MSEAMDKNYLGLRDGIFDRAFGSADKLDPFAVMLDVSGEKSSYTLLAAADGTVSLYLSNGGGIIGMGEIPRVREIGLQFLEMSKERMSALRETSDRGLPPPGKVRFSVIGSTGIHMAVFDEGVLGDRRFPLWSLFSKAQELMNALREAQAKSRKAEEKE